MAKFTKKMRYEDIQAMVNGENPVHGSTPAEIVEFCAAQIDALARKNASNSSRANKKNEENEHFKALIMDYLSENPGGNTCAGIRKAIPEIEAAGEVQKVTALVGQLEKAGMVESVKEHGKLIKRIPRGEAESEE